MLALANTGERFGYYTMLAIFLFFLQAKFGLDATWTCFLIPKWLKRYLLQPAMA